MRPFKPVPVVDTKKFGSFPTLKKGVLQSEINDAELSEGVMLLGEFTGQSVQSAQALLSKKIQTGEWITYFELNRPVRFRSEFCLVKTVSHSVIDYSDEQIKHQISK